MEPETQQGAMDAVLALMGVVLLLIGVYIVVSQSHVEATCMADIRQNCHQRLDFKTLPYAGWLIAIGSLLFLVPFILRRGRKT